MSTNSDSEESSLPTPPEYPRVPNEVLPSIERSFSMALEEECRVPLNQQLQDLGFTAEHSSFSKIISESGDTIGYTFTIVYKKDCSPRRFLFDAKILDLDKYDYRQIIILSSIRDAFLDNFGSGIYMYIVYRREPHLAYRIIMEKRWVRTSRIEKLKLISHESICNIDRIIKLNFNETHLKEVQEYLKELLDLEIDESKLSENAASEDGQKSSQSDPDPKETSSSERRSLINIISKMSVFEDERDRESFVEEYVGIIISNFDFKGNNLAVATKLVGRVLKNTPHFKCLLEALNDHRDIKDGSDEKKLIEHLLNTYFPKEK